MITNFYPINVWIFRQLLFQAYVGCRLGIHMIGRVAFIFGLFNTVGCFLIPPMAKLVGKLWVILGGGIVVSAAVFFMFRWTEDKNNDFLLYLIAAMFGFSDCVWQSLVKGTNCVLTKMFLFIKYFLNNNYPISYSDLQHLLPRKSRRSIQYLRNIPTHGFFGFLFSSAGALQSNEDFHVSRTFVHSLDSLRFSGN